MTRHAHPALHAPIATPARPRGGAGRQGGFTLIEVIISMVVLGALVAVVAVFIRAPILGYRDTVDRAEITDQADLTLRRIARDLRLALPNSVRVTTDPTSKTTAIEFLPTKAGARYLSNEDDGVDLSKILNFEDPGDLSFTAIAPLSSFAKVAAGDYVVVYNLGPGLDPANAYVVRNTACAKGDPAASSRAGNIAQIDTIAKSTASGLTDAYDITLKLNPFACQSPPLSSPAYRLQVVHGPVMYYCTARSDGGWDLWRAWDYKISSTQPTSAPSDAATAMVASRLTRCDTLFSYGTAASQRTGLVVIDMSLRGRNDATPAIRLVHQVHVDNTP
jgi:MSHA biogenesis protein MshO